MKTLFACFSQNLDYALGWMVIHSLWQAIAIALLMGIAMIVLRKKPAKVRYWVANAALLAVLISAMATFSYYYDFSKEPGEVRFIPENSPSLTLPKGEGIESPSLGDLGGNSLSWDSFKNYFNQHIPLIVLVWAMGVALFILKLLGGISYCYYLRSRLNFPADEYWVEILEKLKTRVGVKQSVELVESALTRTPMVVGHLKPMILFPIGAINKLSPTDVEAILAHEIAHVLRKDFIFNIIQSVIEALFYYHPAVWIISSTIRNERENCCDDVAIEICGNSMDYAKALVTVQEMAYFPMYQPALAFAGNRKNQLLYRVQRILNQPQNKTNVMEKLIATCTLVVVMIGLSFGENTFLKDKLTDNITPSVENANSTASTTPTEEIATFYLYFNNKIDSLKVPSEVKNGTYDYEDNTQTATLTVKDGYVVTLKVNGIDLEDGQLPNYKRLINKILRDAINTNKKPERAFEQAGISFDNNGMQMNNNNANLSVDRNGLTLNGVSEGGHSFHLSVDENGFNMNTYDDNGRPLQSTGQTGVFVDDRNNATYIKNGVVTTYDSNGDRWVIKPERDGIKYIEHFNRNNNLTETLKLQNGKTYINNREATSEELRARGWEITDKGIQKIGGFKNIQSYDNFIKNDKLFPTRTDDLRMQRLILKNKHKALNEKALALKRKGVDLMSQINPTMNEVSRELNKDNASPEHLNNIESKLDWVESFIESKEDREDLTDELESEIEELKNNMKELRQEIKECDCTSNFDFRSDLIKGINDLLPNVKSGISQKAFNDIELKFLRIKNDWERGECNDNKNSNSNSNYNSNQWNGFNANLNNNNNLDTRVKSIAKRAEKLIDDINNSNVYKKDPNWVIWAKARLNAQESLAKANKNAYGLGLIENEIGQIQNQFERIKRQDGKSDCYGCPPGNGQQSLSYSSSPNSYSYGTGSSYAEAESARKAAERKAKIKSSDDGDAIHTFFQSLLDEGYISLGKQYAVAFSNEQLKIDNRKITGQAFERIKLKFENVLGESKKYAILYNGRINGSNNNLSITGSLTTSFGK